MPAQRHVLFASPRRRGLKSRVYQRLDCVAQKPTTRAHLDLPDDDRHVFTRTRQIPAITTPLDSPNFVGMLRQYVRGDSGENFPLTAMIAQ
jgi:hypothetical protein